MPPKYISSHWIFINILIPGTLNNPKINIPEPDPPVCSWLKKRDFDADNVIVERKTLHILKM